MFIPHFSGIQDTAEAYHLDGDTYNPNGAFWKFKGICTLAESNRDLYSESTRAFWKQQEQLMYDEMLKAAPVMLAKYAQSKEEGQRYVTALGIRMAEREFKYADNLYAKLFTDVMHNYGRNYGRAPGVDRTRVFLADVPLRQIAESKGYTVTWNGAEQSITMTKGATSYTVTLESYDCKTGDGKTIELSHYVYLADGLTYIPMDFANTL